MEPCLGSRLHKTILHCTTSRFVRLYRSILKLPIIFGVAALDAVLLGALIALLARQHRHAHVAALAEAQRARVNGCGGDHESSV